jgi:hypothetical protein
MGDKTSVRVTFELGSLTDETCAVMDDMHCADAICLAMVGCWA